jgi:hypothetical protein
MRERATPPKKKGLAVIITLTVRRRRATPLKMKAFPVTFALRDQGLGWKPLTEPLV